jgi:hypothetical protein
MLASSFVKPKGEGSSPSVMDFTFSPLSLARLTNDKLLNMLASSFVWPFFCAGFWTSLGWVGSAYSAGFFHQHAERLKQYLLHCSFTCDSKNKFTHKQNTGNTVAVNQDGNPSEH